MTLVETSGLLKPSANLATEFASANEGKSALIRLLRKNG